MLLLPVRRLALSVVNAYVHHHMIQTVWQLLLHVQILVERDHQIILMAPFLMRLQVSLSCCNQYVIKMLLHIRLRNGFTMAFAIVQVQVEVAIHVIADRIKGVGHTGK